ncbi:hypothetical protein CLOSAC_01170 [Clostridium saccharobutylicum]|uniref:Uncharacterized protein n=1 Tax=Clostridium saccharobutylicum TaxID=169679 RepID=A0A1S8NH68_CLOSA|nr:hypothetical protein CLOSAC_01170 [Clostridium saccharobutylicum]
MIKKYLNKIMAFGIHMDFFYTKGYKLENGRCKEVY